MSWMRRIAAIVVVLTLGGCQWTQGWHWPRVNASQPESVVYFEDHTAAYQGWFVWHSAQVWDWAANVRVVYGPCQPDGGCVRWRTGDNAGGLTRISLDGNGHILTAEVELDDQVDGSHYEQDARIACHEAGHSLGGGFDDPSTPWDEHLGLCTDEWPWAGHPTQQNYDAIAAAYAPHAEPGFAFSATEGEVVRVMTFEDRR
jgi:hypothetical protein